MQTRLIVDTNVILSHPEFHKYLENHNLIITTTVLQELDNCKKKPGIVGKNARRFLSFLDSLRCEELYTSGVKLSDEEDSSSLVIVENHSKAEVPDDRIIETAKSLQVSMLTNDVCMRVKAGLKGVEATSWQIPEQEDFKGIIYEEADDEFIGNFLHTKYLPCVEGTMKPNEFILFFNKESGEQALGIYDAVTNRIKNLPLYYKDVWGISGNSVEQIAALNLLFDESIKLVTICGKAGTGKTLMALAAGLKQTVDQYTYHKVLVSRPVTPLGEQEIGFLPGTIEDKLGPWMQPIMDNLEVLYTVEAEGKKKKPQKPTYEQLVEGGFIAIEALAYIRGRSIPNQFIIIDEAQNLNMHELKTIITRAGENTKIILTGDLNQIDSPYMTAENCGLNYLIQSFKGEPIAGHIELHKAERGELAEIAAKIL